MNFRLKFLSLIFVIFQSQISGQFVYKELLSLPWGGGDTHAGLREAPGGTYGPTAFKVYDEIVYILDKENMSLKTFSNTKLQMIERIPSKDIDYFNISENGQVFYTHYDKGVHMGEIETKLVKRGQGAVVKNGKVLFSVHEENLGYLSCIGKLREEYYYILREIITRDVPLIVQRDVILYDRYGIKKAIFDFPVHLHTYIPEEFYVDEGNLYKMISSTEGIHIIGWMFNGEIPNTLKRYILPEKYNINYHFNDEIMNEPDILRIDEESKNNRESLDYPPVTPSEALTTAYQYTYHEWTATEDNLTGGLIQDPDGVYIETPDWVGVGTNYSIPYKWGGFNTLSGYDGGMQSGMYAGDKETSGVSSYTCGVDCSGFVSRCWKLPVHYSTSMMDDWITIAYDSWSELKPGDAIHKVGHVRLFVHQNTDGSLVTAEASGYDWKVNYHTYTLSQLNSYTPRYYVYMNSQESPVIRTDFKSVIVNDSLRLKWDGINNTFSYGYTIYGSNDGVDWDILGTAPQHINQLAMDLNSLDSHNFFKITNISAEDSISESLPSDYYGANVGSTDQKILLVDGFDRNTGSGSYSLPYHPFAMTAGKALKTLGVSFETIENSTLVDGEIEMEGYEAVFWLLGDESTADETFSDSEQELVKAYLRQGGKMFVTGSEIAWDLDYRGDAQDNDFIYNYFKVGMAYDDAESFSVNGVQDTPFFGLSFSYDDGLHGVYEEDYPDAFSLQTGSATMLKYANNRRAGVGWTGFVPQGTQEAAFFILGIPFETIYTESNRIEFMEKLLTYFGFDIHMNVDDNNAVLPRIPMLHSVFPNPFNPTTIIRFQLPSNGDVRLDIYNLRGQLVKTLINENRQAGLHHVKWNGKDMYGKAVSTGTYFAIMQNGTHRYVKKMVLLK
ncbi:MAG: T9SS type A sorting domain-containing protein [Candidatus Marinimicrobia bacterium]|nr:T9SS type A sorting domain-containing protein [Candidatus Neomarinimicrobiota bacterium]